MEGFLFAIILGRNIYRIVLPLELHSETMDCDSISNSGAFLFK